MRRVAAGLLALAGACDSPAAQAPPQGRWEGSEGPERAAPPPASSSLAPPPPRPAHEDAASVLRALAGRAPAEFGERVRGVRRKVDAAEDVLALTVDLCDGRGAGALDRELFELLRVERIPAAVFVSGPWAKANTEALLALAGEPHLSIENHGATHRPCSVDGRSAYGLAGTRSLAAAVAEIEDQSRLLTKLVGAPRFFRPGTAHLDDVCAEAAERLGTPVVGYVLSDAGAGLSRGALAKSLGSARPGSILLLHGGKPRGSSFEGLRDALPVLRARGVRFARLRDVVVR